MSFAKRVLQLVIDFVVDVFYGIPKRLYNKVVTRTVDFESDLVPTFAGFVVDSIKVLVFIVAFWFVSPFIAAAIGVILLIRAIELLIELVLCILKLFVVAILKGLFSIVGQAFANRSATVSNAI
jgi:hypothetical protein